MPNREPEITLTLAQWLEAAGPKAVVQWLSETANELAVRDTLRWRFWTEMSGLFGDVAKCLPSFTTLDDVIEAPADDLAATLLSAKAERVQ